MSEGKKNLVVAIDEELHQKLKIYCVERKISIKELITNLISKELNQTQERSN